MYTHVDASSYGQAVTDFNGAMQAAGEGAPWACRALFEGASCAMSDDWLLQQRRLQRARHQEAAERARDAAVAAAAQVRLQEPCSRVIYCPTSWHTNFHCASSGGVHSWLQVQKAVLGLYALVVC